MQTKLLRVLIRKARHVYVDALTAGDAIPVRVYKSDLLAQLPQDPAAECGLWADEHHDGMLFVHPDHTNSDITT